MHSAARSTGSGTTVAAPEPISPVRSGPGPASTTRDSSVTSRSRWRVLGPVFSMLVTSTVVERVGPGLLEGGGRPDDLDVHALPVQHPRQGAGALRAGVARVEVARGADAAAEGDHHQHAEHQATRDQERRTVPGQRTGRAGRRRDTHRTPSRASSRSRTASGLVRRGRPVAVPHQVEDVGGDRGPGRERWERLAEGHPELVGGGAGHALDPAPLDLAQRQGAEPVDHGVPVPAFPEGGVRPGPQLRGAQPVVGERGRAGAAAARGEPGPGEQPAEGHDEHDQHDHRREGGQRRGPGCHVEAAGDLLAQPRDDAVEEGLVVVLRAEQLTPQPASGPGRRSGSAAGRTATGRRRS